MPRALVDSTLALADELSEKIFGSATFQSRLSTALSAPVSIIRPDIPVLMLSQHFCVASKMMNRAQTISLLSEGVDAGPLEVGSARRYSGLAALGMSQINALLMHGMVGCLLEYTGTAPLVQRLIDSFGKFYPRLDRFDRFETLDKVLPKNTGILVVREITSFQRALSRHSFFRNHSDTFDCIDQFLQDKEQKNVAVCLPDRLPPRFAVLRPGPECVFALEFAPELPCAVLSVDSNGHDGPAKTGEPESPFSFFVDDKTVTLVPSTLFSPIEDLEREQGSARASNMRRLRDILCHDISRIYEIVPELFHSPESLPLVTLSLTGIGLDARFHTDDVEQLVSYFSYSEEIVARCRDLVAQGEPIITLRFMAPEDPQPEDSEDMLLERGDLKSIERQLSDALYHSFAHFGEFFSFLRTRFEVELTNHGKGGHKGLERAGYYFALSKNFRSEKDPLNHQIALSAVKALRLPLKEVLRELTLFKHRN